MRIGEGVEWALHSCVVLAALPEGAGLPGARLAEFHELPAAYLAKHLQALSRAGITESLPGRHGGYRLARDPHTIKVSEIVEAVEGSGRAYRCTEIRRKGPAAPTPSTFKQACLIARVMWGAERAWIRELEKWTLADLALLPGTEAHSLAGQWISRVLARPQEGSDRDRSSGAAPSCYLDTGSSVTAGAADGNTQTA